MNRPSGAPTLAELRALSDEALVEKYDQISGKEFFSSNDVLNELMRRESSKQTRAMLRYTLWIVLMTLIVTLTTIVNLVIAFLLYRKPS